MEESVTIKINLDITQSKREFEEQKKAVNQQEQTVDRVRQKFKKSFEEGRDLYSSWKALDPEARSKKSSRSFNRYMMRRQGEDPSGNFDLLKSTKTALGIDDMAWRNNMSSTVKAGVAGGTALYAGLRLGNTIGVGLLEAIKGAVPGVENLPGFEAIQNQVEGIAKAMDDFENRIMGFVNAAFSTYSLGKAGANISGGQPIEYSIYAAQDYNVAVAEGNLDRAFDRFKYKNLARSLGELTTEAFKRASK